VGLAGSRCSNTRCAKGSRRGCPCPDLRGLRAAMHALRGLARLSGVALPCSPPAGSIRGHCALGNQAQAGRRSPRGCARVSRRLQKSARSARCSGSKCGRGRACSKAPSRAAYANRRIGTAARTETRERGRSRALFVVGRCSSSASTRSPFTRWAGRAAWGLRGGCRCKAGQRGGTRSARSSSGGRPSGRERRGGDRAAGRSG
jgi:hypothetical protein